MALLDEFNIQSYECCKNVIEINVTVNYLCNAPLLLLIGSLSEILELLSQVVDEVVDLGDARAVPHHLLLEVHLVEQCAQVLVRSAHDRVLRRVRVQ